MQLEVAFRDVEGEEKETLFKRKSAIFDNPKTLTIESVHKILVGYLRSNYRKKNTSPTGPDWKVL